MAGDHCQALFLQRLFRHRVRTVHAGLQIRDLAMERLRGRWCVLHERSLCAIRHRSEFPQRFVGPVDVLLFHVCVRTDRVLADAVLDDITPCTLHRCGFGASWVCGETLPRTGFALQVRAIERPHHPDESSAATVFSSFREKWHMSETGVF